jgi:drug/metabolite transporter (DMT)-like permease
MDPVGELIPILISLGMFAMIFGIVYLYKRERMAMIERGMDPRSYKPQAAPYQNLKWGLLLIGAGLGLCLAYILERSVFQDNDNPAMYFGLIAIFGGIGLFISFLIERKDTTKHHNEE